MKKAVLNILKIVFVVTYPFLIFWALGQGYSPRFLSLLLILVVLFQFKTQKVKLVRNVIFVCAIALFSGLWLYDNAVFLKLYPVLVSLSLLIIFGLSLKYSPSMAEKFASLKHKDLPDYAIKYCRKVTFVWTMFFLFNASVAFITVFLSTKAWVLYNGFISYILIGVIFATEFLIRNVIQKREEKK